MATVNAHFLGGEVRPTSPAIAGNSARIAPKSNFGGLVAALETALLTVMLSFRLWSSMTVKSATGTGRTAVALTHYRGISQTCGALAFSQAFRANHAHPTPVSTVGSAAGPTYSGQPLGL